MPFQSRRQSRKCYAMKNKNQNGSWDCSEWAHATNYKKLPEKVSGAALLGKLAGLNAAEASKPPAPSQSMLKPSATGQNAIQPKVVGPSSSSKNVTGG